MRILLAHNSRYYPAQGGGDVSNRLLMEALIRRGHACRVVARTAGGVVASDRGGVEVRVAPDGANVRAYFAAQIAEFAPDAILCSTDDPAQVLFAAALQAAEARVVYLARATLALPFGPDGAFPSAAKSGLLRQADGVVAVSRYVADYIRKWSGIQAVPLPISPLAAGPYSQLGCFDNEFVTMVNPCAVKGISIFLGLAARMPAKRFAAVPLWGTTRQDRSALEALPNVSLLDPVEEIDELFARTRGLLVPSLWAEARSRIVVEAMLRGVPVLASNVGGIPEAKLGVPYLLPVRPIVKYHPRLNEQMVPLADVPEQDIGPWAEALGRLLTDRAHYKELSRASREAALAYAANLSIGPFERYLDEIVQAPRRPRDLWAPETDSPLDRLSPERRRLLALRLRKTRPTGNAWFPDADGSQTSALRLFAFPHAGGGAATFHRWRPALPAGVALWPVRLPGRESRLSETPFESMAPLVEALGQAIQPLLSGPFAFYGHSLGAAIAFELARQLRRRSLPLPRCLFVSGARAPRFRLNHLPPPEPSDAELLDELRGLGGVPDEALDNPEWRSAMLPALRADSALYRSYAYREEPPLECAIRAYGGLEDSRITRAHLEAWRDETSGSFAVTMLPGGHFFNHSAQFPETLARDLWE
jgi:surfactin synthase thioesterase subunit/glycosyltransferase involved in cell wall biosynthesis